ncbi:MAG TPA: TM0106 family RecB-like putative nuclease [Gaiellaceae bacterium]|nr:TM0106 family RecB-like putative nuclease [Gaiellaceae bacterium]
MKASDGRILLSPGDVTGFLACRHLTALSIRAARGEIEHDGEPNEHARLLFEKGLAHERAYLARLRAEGNTVAEIPEDGTFDERAEATRAALASGVDVVYQGVLVADGWRGVADFLVRQPDGTYEALDTKLARSAKPAYILQLCFYSEQLARVQGREPEHMHVLLGNGETESFRPREFDAYARRVRARLEAFVADPPATEPYPVDHCELCEFLPRCDAWWDEVDHLCRVAGLYRAQIEKLRADGISTLAALARADRAPADVDPEAFARLRRQAELQLIRRETGALAYELVEPVAGAGLALLPDASPGDLFFDIEGNPFWDETGSLEYLWGVLDTRGAFEPIWADGHASEQAAYEAFVDLVHRRLAADPALHVYHYAAYEVTALRRLTARYGTREAEVEDLLSRGVFVDLYKIVRGGLQASVRGYGLKELEAFLDFRREAEIRDGRTSIVEYERYVETHDPSILGTIAAYNREDCVATHALRDWLLERRDEALAQFGPFPQPEPEGPEEERERAEPRESAPEPGADGAAPLVDFGTAELRFLAVEEDDTAGERVAREVQRLLETGLSPGEIMVLTAADGLVDTLRATVPAAIAVAALGALESEEAGGCRAVLLAADPGLLDVNCRTIDQMRFANALCRFVELAEVVTE